VPILTECLLILNMSFFLCTSSQQTFIVAMAQLLQRLRFNWLGEAAPEAATKHTFKVVITLCLCYLIFTLCLEVAEYTFNYDTVPTWIVVTRFAGGMAFTIYSIYSLMRLRENVRAKYSIPTDRCGGAEDMCCSMWCSCCVVSQIARHTGEYETYKGSLCSETGMAAHTPSLV
jgi:hypothetical protein